MADPISLASGLLTLVAFALQSGKSLYQVIESFQSNQKKIRQLKEELGALDEVLNSLLDAASSQDVDLTSLKLPLLRCGKACRDFEIVIAKCTAHSAGPKTSFRDWAKLRYMGDDIAGFKEMLAGYKSTISIALGDATIRTAAVTVSFLREYKTMIANTTSDLEDHLQKIDDKLQVLSLRDAVFSDEDVAERQRIQEERDSTEQCLGICAQVSAHINQVQPNTFENISTPSGAHRGQVTGFRDNISARLVTANTLRECRERLTNTSSQLERHLQDINNRLQFFPSQELRVSNEQVAEQERIREEIDSIKQCLAICAQASEEAEQDRTNVFEDVSAAEDGHQVIVATFGDLISAKKVSAAAGASQWLGQMSDASLQQLSQIHGHTAIQKATEPRSGMTAQFEGRYGAGYKLSSGNIKGLGGSHQ